MPTKGYRTIAERDEQRAEHPRRVYDFNASRSTRHTDGIAGTRVIDGLTIKFAAVFLSSVDLWEVTVTDHIGDRTKDTVEHPWSAIEAMTNAAVETSRKAAAEIMS